MYIKSPYHADVNKTSGKSNNCLDVLLFPHPSLNEPTDHVLPL